jgi:hypothetical protein
VSLYKAPPANTHVVCLDEMGPISATTYWAARWSPKRPTVTPDYGRRAKRWVFGAFEPRTGLVVTQCADKRDTRHFLALLNQVVATWPQRDLILIMDNLSTHKALDVRLWALAHPRVHFLFQPTYAPWLNLIEPWWKTLRSLALKGRRFDGAADLDAAIASATTYWNDTRHPYTWHKAA